MRFSKKEQKIIKAIQVVTLPIWGPIVLIKKIKDKVKGK